MRFATICTAGRCLPVAVTSEGAIDLSRRAGRHAEDLGDVLRDGWWEEALAIAEEGGADLAIEDVEWLPPVRQPQHVLCAGVNYHSHREEVGRQTTEHPTIFMRAWSSQIGHGADLVAPRVSGRLDYEGELAVVVARGGRYIPEHEAYAHLAGASCYNDGTIRDYQHFTTQWTPGKNFPGTGAFGPELVTFDEVDTESAELTTSVNGEELQRARLGDMIFSIPQLVAFVSEFCELVPGDVIVTGTPGGVGFKRTPPRFLAPGDRVDVAIDGVGTLSNVVMAEA